MRSHLSFGSTDVIVVEATSFPMTLHPAVGGAQVDLRVRVSVQEGTPTNVPYELGATMFVSRAVGQDPQMLCLLATDYLPRPGLQGWDVPLRGFISDAQMLAMDKLRADGDLWIRLQMCATRVDPPPAPLLARQTGTLDMPLAASDWLRAFQGAQSGSYLELLIALTGDPLYVEAVQHIVKGRQLIREGHRRQGVVEVRQAVEMVRDGDGATLLPQRDARTRTETAKKAAPKDRTREQRWLVAADAVFSLMSDGAHPGGQDDWTEAEAEAVVMLAASLLHQKAAEKAALSTPPVAVYPLPDQETVAPEE